MRPKMSSSRLLNYRRHLQKISDVKIEIRTVAAADTAKATQEIQARKQIPIVLGQTALSDDLVYSGAR